MFPASFRCEFDDDEFNDSVAVVLFVLLVVVQCFLLLFVVNSMMNSMIRRVLFVCSAGNDLILMILLWFSVLLDLCLQVENFVGQNLAIGSL